MRSTAPEPIRVLVVEDSEVVRLLLEQIIAADPRLRVVGSVGDGEAAIEAVRRVRPDVISMDIRMPRLDGFETTRRIMETQPTPIVVVSASVEADDLKISMNALRAGALTVVEKPVGLTHSEYAGLARTLCQQLVLMSSVKLVRQRPGVAPRPAPGRSRTAADPPAGGYRALGLVASTGGPGALATVLGGLGRDFPLPCLVVQHMTPSFLAGFVSWLDATVPMPVRLARDGERPLPGHAYVAPAEAHLRLAGPVLRLDPGPAEDGQRLSGTAMFESIAGAAGARGIGVVLTGMGRDGADGLNAIRRAGGFTIAEHRSSAVVYGMPAAAVALGAACEELPLPQIGPRLSTLAAAARVTG